MRKDIQRILYAALVGSLLLAGCAEPVKPRIVWPLPPEEPRIEFIGIFSSEIDFPKTRGERRLAAFLGESGEARFKSPIGVVADGRGTVYVSDLHDRNVRIYDFNRRTVEFLSKLPVFGSPLGLALDGRGRLYIADGDKNQVLVYDPAGRRPLHAIGSRETLSRPAYLAVHEALGRLYVADGQGHRIVVFDLDGRHLFTFGKLGAGPGELYSPQGLAFGPDGLLYVADHFNARIQVFTADGDFVRAFGERGDQVFQFESPTDLAFDSEGNLWVVDGRRGHILTYTPEGELLLVTGAEAPTSHPLGFATPRAIHIDANDRIYVSDMLNKRFSVWQYFSAAYRAAHPLTEDELRLLRQEQQKKPAAEKK